ncbi:MAG: dipeptidase [Pirellulales bacterium]
MNRRNFLRLSAGASLAAAVGTPSARAAQAPAEATSQIERARQAALAILKPTAKQLEHGLELHAASLVWESYGFAPLAAWDGDALRKAIEAGASPNELEDLREEMSMTRVAIDPAERAEFLAAWKAAGVTCIFQNAGEETQDPMRLIKRLARFTYVTDRMRDVVVRAVVPEDVVAAKKQGKHCLYFSGNGVPLAQRWESPEDKLSYLRIFFQLGIRMMHMTYNRRNMLGDGCAEPANAGLSDLGRAAVAEMNRLGVIADVAHSGWQTSLETAKASSRPMVASHTACDAVHHGIRAKPDGVIKAIADTGGYIGICCIPAFLGGKGNIQSMLDHVDYAVRRFGAEHVAIGTDVEYTSPNQDAEAEKVPKTGKTRPRWEALWPPGSRDFRGDRLSLAWTNWPLFTVGMVQRGYSDADIQKILGGNVMRVATAALARN